jgi:HSP20 family molecular chaperone IbpA
MLSIIIQIMNTTQPKLRPRSDNILMAGDEWLDKLYNVPYDEFFTLKLTIPPANIYETSDSYKIFIGCAGVQKKDLKVEVTKGVLTVRCKKIEEVKKEREGLKKQEYDYTNWERSFAIPKGLQMEKAAVTYSNGELRIIIKKRGNDDSISKRKSKNFSLSMQA